VLNRGGHAAGSLVTANEHLHRRGCIFISFKVSQSS
jgi:hypothetical protein